MNHLLRILHLKAEPAHNTRNRTAQLGTGKVLPNASTLAMQEGNLRKVGRRAARVISRAVGVDPPLGEESVSVGAPELGAAVDSVGTEYDARALGDVLAGDGGVADGFADRDGDSGVQTEDLLADSVEEREGFQVRGGDRVVTGRDTLADLRAQTLLHLRVEGQQVAGPGEGTGGCLVTGSEEGHHLVDELVVGEVAAEQHGAEDVGLEGLRGGFCLGDHGALLAHDVLAEVAQEACLLVDDAVEAEGQALDEPLREHEVDC